MTVLEGVVAWSIGMLLIVGAAMLIRGARRGGKTMHVIGAALTLMTMGNVRDPANEKVEIAKQPRKKESGESGDPPND